MIDTQKILAVSKSDGNKLLNRAGKLSEELGEFWAALLCETASPNASASSEPNVLEEGTDVLICVLDVLYRAGYDDVDIQHMVDTKTEKWAAKNLRVQGVPKPF